MTRGKKPKPVRVCVADKSPLVRRALRDLFGGDGRFQVVAIVDDGLRFLEGVDRLVFEVGVIGWVMPGADGRAVLRALRSRPDAPRIVVYTGHPSADVARHVMSLGGAGYCSKTRPPEELLEIVAAVGAGQMVFPMLDVRKLAANPVAGLTERERDLLAALCEGATNADLARRFELSLQTVKFHLKRIYAKIGVSNRAGAVALYLSQAD